MTISKNIEVSHNKKAISNPILVFHRNISSDIVLRIEKSYKILDDIRENFSQENILRDEQIQYHQQELWGFKSDRSFHNWHNFRGCRCSNHNNELSAYGRYQKFGYRVVSKQCLLHIEYHDNLVKSGDLIQVSPSDFYKDITDVEFNIDSNKFYKIIRP